MTEEKYELEKTFWKELLKKEVKSNYDFFTKPENDLQSLIPLILKYQKNHDLTKLTNTKELFFSSQARWGFCGADLSNLDLSMLSKESLARITFDTDTKWPKKDKLPKGFNPQELLNKAKSNIGLGVESLHKQNITGKGVKVAYIDKGFDVKHEEFKGRNIEYNNYQENEDYDFHGYAVASRLLGKNCGIATDVDMLYFNCGCGNLPGLKNELKALKTILNRVKNGENIVAVGISASIPSFIENAFNKKQITEEEKNKLTNKYEDLKNQLKQCDCTVISADEFWDSGFSYAYKINPLEDNSNLENFAQYGNLNDKVSVIESDKVVPSVFTKDGYKYENIMGCASWSIPQIVGLYCLAKQVDPKITYEKFVEISHKTANEPNQHGTRLINAVELIKEVNLSHETNAEI